MRVASTTVTSAIKGLPTNTVFTGVRKVIMRTSSIGTVSSAAAAMPQASSELPVPARMTLKIPRQRKIFIVCSPKYRGSNYARAVKEE